MNFSELKALVAEDLVIDRDKLDEESLRTPILYKRYIDLYSEFSTLYKKIDLEYKKKYRERYSFYAGWSEEPFEYEVSKGTDIKMLVESDDEILELSQRKILVKEKLDYIEKVCNAISRRGFEIKSAIDWMKFESGGY